MAATHEFSESNTVSETITEPISKLNFGSADAPNLNTTTYCILRGQSSFEKYLRCKFTGVFTEISAMKFWQSAGSYVEGESRTAAANVAFATPSANPNADSAIPVTEGTALAILSAEGAATIVYGASGVSGYSGYLRSQLKTTGTTPSGSIPQLATMFQYDEI